MWWRKVCNGEARHVECSVCHGIGHETDMFHVSASRQEMEDAWNYPGMASTGLISDIPLRYEPVRFFVHEDCLKERGWKRCQCGCAFIRKDRRLVIVRKTEILM
jgi:hypothetical protein